MKKKLTAWLFLIAAGVCAASLDITPNGQAELRAGTEKLALIYPHFGTRNPQRWFKPGNPDFQCAVNPGKDGIQTFSGEFPANASGVPVKFSGSWNMREKGKAEFRIEWRTASEDLREQAVFIELPMALLNGGKLKINEKEYPVENTTRYGIFAANIKKQDLMFYRNESGKQIRVRTSDPCNLVGQSIKDRCVIIRLHALRGKTNLHLILEF